MLGNGDLLALVLSLAQLLPHSFVAASRVSKGWRAACCGDEQLLLRSARARAYLTKRDLVGLFALSSAEADRLPRRACSRRDGGVM